MPHARIIPPAQVSRSPSAVWTTFEATTSVFFAFTIGFFIAVGAGTAAVLSFGERGANAAAWEAWVPPAAAAVAVGELAFLWWLKVRLESATGGSRVPQIALRQRQWPLLLRPVMAIWWLAHLGIAVGAMIVLERGASFLSEVGRVQSALMLGLLLFGYFTISHSTHLYAMLAISSTGARRERWVFAWWRKRFLIDAIVTLVAVGFSLRRAL